MIDLTSLSADKFLILGYGLSGKATAKALKASGKHVTVWDDQEDNRNLAAQDGYTFGGTLDGVDMLVVAPSVLFLGERAHPMIKEARSKNIEITNDIGVLKKARPNARIIGITGTNGKSTTTALIGHILDVNKVSASVGGNLGRPALDLENEVEYYVLELSSYQLESCDYLEPFVAILLNITPDHLDHHGSMDNYIAAKERLFKGAEHAIRAERLDYKKGSYKGHDLTVHPRLKGLHNWQNMATAYEACKAVGLSDDQIWTAMESFEGLAHRQFKVRELDGVSYINDSKATNVDATLTAVRAFDHIHLIVGGLAKEGGLQGLETEKDRLLKLYLIGDAAAAFEQWCIKNKIAFEQCGTVEQAVQAARTNARAGDVVLFSPACASFDQFSNFSERGLHFETIVNGLV